jgi:hypothetical protein
MFDRGLTASPTPLSDIGDSAPAVQETRGPVGVAEDAYAFEYRYRYETTAGADGYPYPYQPLEIEERRAEVFDPDGEFIVEPESPDKTGEVMLFPER